MSVTNLIPMAIQYVLDYWDLDVHGLLILQQLAARASQNDISASLSTLPPPA